MEREMCLRHVEALRTILDIEHLKEKDSGVQLDQRSEDTVKLVLTFVKENEERLRDLADYLEASKNESHGRLQPGRQYLSAHKVDSGIGTSENRLSNITNTSTSSFYCGESEPSSHDRDEEKKHHPFKDNTDDSNHSDMNKQDHKISASSFSSVFGSEKEMAEVTVIDTIELKEDSEIAASDKITSSFDVGKVSEIDSSVDREQCSGGSGCMFTLGTPSQSSSNIECETDLSVNAPITDALHNEVRNGDKMNIPLDAQHEKELNIPNKRYSREELLSRSLSTTSNNLNLQRMLEPRENSSSSDSDNLPSFGSEGSICGMCGARRTSQRPSVDINSPLFY